MLFPRRPNEWIAVVCIATGLVFNPWFVGFFSTKGYLFAAKHYLLFAADLMLIAFGLLCFARPKLIPKLSVMAVSFAAGWAMLESAAYFVLRNRQAQQAVQSCEGCPFLEADENLGIRARPNGRIQITGTIQGKQVYQARYSMNKQGFRITPQPQGPAKSHVLFLGCSYTFGESVNDDETMPYYFGKARRDAGIYNFGIPGYGPQQALSIVQSDRMHTIRPPTGAAIYTFIDHHVNRATGMMNVFNAWAAQFPYYEVDGQKVTHRGTFFSARPSRSYFYRWMSYSPVLNLLDWPPDALLTSRVASRLGFRNVADTLAILNETAKQYLQRFPTSKFYVVLFPGENRFAHQISDYFKATPVSVLDYSNQFDPHSSGRMIPGNPHPKADVYQQVAELLARDIRFDSRTLSSQSKLSDKD